MSHCKDLTRLLQVGGVLMQNAHSVRSLSDASMWIPGMVMHTQVHQRMPVMLLLVLSTVLAIIVDAQQHQQTAATTDEASERTSTLLQQQQQQQQQSSKQPGHRPRLRSVTADFFNRCGSTRHACTMCLP